MLYWILNNIRVSQWTRRRDQRLDHCLRKPQTKSFCLIGLCDWDSGMVLLNQRRLKCLNKQLQTNRAKCLWQGGVHTERKVLLGFTSCLLTRRLILSYRSPFTPRLLHSILLLRLHPNDGWKPNTPSLPDHIISPFIDSFITVLTLHIFL